MHKCRISSRNDLDQNLSYDILKPIIGIYIIIYIYIIILSLDIFGGMISAISWPRFVSSVTRSAAAGPTTRCVMLSPICWGPPLSGAMTIMRGARSRRCCTSAGLKEQLHHVAPSFFMFFPLRSTEDVEYETLAATVSFGGLQLAPNCGVANSAKIRYIFSSVFPCCMSFGSEWPSAAQTTARLTRQLLQMATC